MVVNVSYRKYFTIFTTQPQFFFKENTTNSTLLLSQQVETIFPSPQAYLRGALHFAQREFHLLATRNHPLVVTPDLTWHGITCYPFRDRRVSYEATSRMDIGTIVTHRSYSTSTVSLTLTRDTLDF